MDVVSTIFSPAAFVSRSVLTGKSRKHANAASIRSTWVAKNDRRRPAVAFEAEPRSASAVITAGIA